jgi:hypothetical protein
MNLRELLLVALVLWTAIGLVGSTVLLVQGERAKSVRGVAWIVGVWVVYLGVLVGVSLVQRQKVVALGRERCFDEMCFAVTGVQEMQGFLIQDGRRLVRVTVRVTNRGRRRAQSKKLIRAYLMDAQGRTWNESAGVGGVPLTVRVAAGDSVISEPVFKVAKDATGLGLVFTHGWKQPGVLVIGDSDSLWHQRTVVWLGL